MYLVLIIFFFPETRYAKPGFFSTYRVSTSNFFVHRNMTIEAVSVLFDTGRKGDALAASRQFGNGAGEKEMELADHDHVDDAEKKPNERVASA